VLVRVGQSLRARWVSDEHTIYLLRSARQQEAVLQHRRTMEEYAAQIEELTVKGT
jgi:hypothetical protein